MGSLAWGLVGRVQGGVHGLEVGVWGEGFRVWGLGFGVWGCRVDFDAVALIGIEGPERLDREIFIGNLLVRVHFIIETSRPALRHGSLDSLFQVALYLPS